MSPLAAPVLLNVAGCNLNVAHKYSFCRITDAKETKPVPPPAYTPDDDGDGYGYGYGEDGNATGGYGNDSPPYKPDEPVYEEVDMEYCLIMCEDDMGASSANTSDTDAAPPPAEPCMPSVAPPTTHECAPCDPNDCAVHPVPPQPMCPNDCSGHGKCDKDVGVCVCEPTYYGHDCADGCPAGADCECCPSAVFGMSPNSDATEPVCCGPAYGATRPTVDKDGVCCDGALDACGICNGDGFAIDMRGACCTVRLSASLICHATLHSCMCSGVGSLQHACAVLPRFPS